MLVIVQYTKKTERSRLKYIIVFASRHPHAMFIMNDIIINYIGNKFGKLISGIHCLKI